MVVGGVNLTRRSVRFGDVDDEDEVDFWLTLGTLDAFRLVA